MNTDPAARRLLRATCVPVKHMKETGSVMFSVRRWLATLPAAGFAALLLLPASPALAKDFNIAGTVECGQRSGRACSIDDTVQLWTDDIGGTRQLVTVDISWIRKRLPNLEQDDAVDFEVRDLPTAAGGLQAIGVTGEGSFVNRLNWGVRENYTTCNDSIRAHVGRSRDDDEAMAQRVKFCRDLRKK